MLNICIRCQSRPVAINPRTGKPGKICAVCFVEAVYKLIEEVDDKPLDTADEKSYNGSDARENATD